jgi:hypothetical protein
VRIILEVSECQYELLSDAPTIPMTQPAHVVLDVPGCWVQQTYEWLRLAPDGSDLLAYSEGWWVALVDFPVTEAELIDGTKLEPQAVKISDMKFTDVVICS